MWFAFLEGVRGWFAGLAVLGVVVCAAVGLLLRQRQRQRGERLRSRQLQAELMAYMLLDDWRVADGRAMGRRICRTISRYSAFGTAALLVRDTGGRLQVTASQRTDDLTVQALERWAGLEQSREEQRGDKREENARAVPELVRLERRSGYRPGDPAALAWCTALIVPMCNRRGRVTGAIAVRADQFLDRPLTALEEALEPLEVLAARFAEGLDTLVKDDVPGRDAVAVGAQG